MRTFEFLSDIYDTYQAEIDEFVTDKLVEHDILSEYGEYKDNEWNIDSYGEAVQHFGYEWIDEMVAKGVFKEIANDDHTDGYYEILDENY